MVQLSCLERQISVSACIVIRLSCRCSQCAPITQSIRQTVDVVRAQPVNCVHRSPSVAHVPLDRRRTDVTSPIINHRRRNGFVLCHPRADPSQCPPGLVAISIALAQCSIAHFRRPSVFSSVILLVAGRPQSSCKRQGDRFSPSELCLEI